jgi:hypothetical protein
VLATAAGAAAAGAVVAVVMGMTLCMEVVMLVGMGVVMVMLVAMLMGVGNTVMGVLMGVGMLVAMAVAMAGMVMVNMHMILSLNIFYYYNSQSAICQIPIYRAVVIEAKPKASPKGEVPRRGGGVCGSLAMAITFGSSTPQSAALTAPLEGSLLGCLHCLKQLDKPEFGVFF